MDTVYSPVSDKDEESETHVDVPFESFRENQKAYQRETGTEPDDFDLSVEEATEARIQRREAPSPENASERPLVRLRSESDAPLKLREAATDLSYSHRWQTAQDLVAAGVPDEAVGELARSEREARERGDPLDPPPDEVKVIDHFGEEGKELDASEAADKITEWRAEQERQRQAELAEFIEARQQDSEQQAQPQREQQAQPQRPDPVQQERQQAAIERQTAEAVKQLSFAEVAGLNSLARLTQQVQRDFPELAQVQSEQDLQILHNNLQAQNPARARTLAQADQAMRQTQAALAQLTNQRKAHEAHQQQAAAQQRAAARAAEDAAFETLAAKHIPNWETVHGEVRAQARKTLESAGLSQDQIHRLWNGSDSVDAHSSVLQLVLAKAALWDRANEKAKQVRQAPMPSVIRPGVGISRGYSDQEHVSSLKARLKSAKGNTSLKVATELLRAQRAQRG